MQTEIIRRIKYWGLAALIIFGFLELIIFDSQRLRVLDNIETIQNEIKDLETKVYNLTELIESGLGSSEKRFLKIEKNLEKLQDGIPMINQESESLRSRFDYLEERLKNAEKIFQALDTGFQNLDKRLSTLEQSTATTKHKKLKERK